MLYRMMKIIMMVMGRTMQEAAGGALLAFVFAGPIEVVAEGEFDLAIDLADGFFDGGAEVAVADGVLDGDVAGAAFAVDLFGAVGGVDLGDLGEGDAFAGGGDDADVADGLGVGAVVGCVAGGDVVAGFAVEDLGDGVAANCGFDGVLDIGYIDAEAGGGLTVDGVVEVRLADDAEEAEVGDTGNLGHDADDLVGSGLEGL